jgi:hypothetical protein
MATALLSIFFGAPSGKSTPLLYLSSQTIQFPECCIDEAEARPTCKLSDVVRSRNSLISSRAVARCFVGYEAP